MEINNTVLREAIKIFGELHQEVKAIEEMAELQQELAKYTCCNGDYGRIAEEMADVYIMLQQLLMIFDNSDLVQAYIMLKVIRLENKLKEVKKDE